MQRRTFLPGITLAFSIALSVIQPATTKAQVKWPEITQQTKPWARWWWEGSAVDNKNLTAVMEEYKAAGLGGLEVTPIYGIKGEESRAINFLSDKWMSVFEHTLAEGKRLDLGIDLANATGWPFGGPWVTPADASKELRYKVYEVKAGQSLTEKVEFIQEPLVRAEGGKKVSIKDVKQPLSLNKNLQDLALDQIQFQEPLPLMTLMAYDDQSNSIELTDKVDASGKLQWKAPADHGQWRLYALFEGQHGKMVERAAPGGEGLVIDHFSKTALQHYLQRFDQAFKGESLEGLRAFFNDSYEVDDARGQADITPELFSFFKTRRGYDLKKYLPALLGKGTDDTSIRVLTDYRRTIGELLLEHFTEPWEDWAKKYHKIIRNQSHGSPANILDLYGAIDIPETEGEDRLRFKFASSSAQVLGKPLISSESATWLKDHFLASFGDVKAAMDLYFLGGVNHTFYHGVAYSPLSAPWPGWLFYAAVHFSPTNPQWTNFSALNAYVARVQSFLQSSRPDNDILQYYPIYDSYAKKGRALLNHYDGMKGFEGTDFDDNANWMLEKGYGFDFISDKQIEGLKMQDGQLTSPGGKYKTILLSAVQHLPVQTLEKLMALVDGGAQLIVFKRLPKDVPGLGQLEQRQAKFDKLIAALHFEKGENGVQTAKFGKGQVLLGDGLDRLLEQTKVQRETMVDDSLVFTRRINADNQYTYFIDNRSENHIDGWINLSKQAGGAIGYNPMSQKAGKIPVKIGGQGELSVYLQLAPGESIILKTTGAAATGVGYPYYKKEDDAVTVKGPWTLSFKVGGPILPKARKLNEAKFWTEIDKTDSVFNRFAGIGIYTTEFKKPKAAQTATTWRLELGAVKENASVWLNGQQLGVVLGPHYAIDFPASLLKANNHLEIRVASLMANRIRYMDQHHIVYKKFYNTNFPAHDAENRGPDGLFTAAGWDVKPAGLGGPVQLVPLSNFQPGE
ncbi:MAG TPA: glycosyl hydrolase [Arachidicoccus sp.]|nr:glycosyl hydrolase [Arachidicoccus sp.]